MSRRTHPLHSAAQALSRITFPLALVLLQFWAYRAEALNYSLDHVTAEDGLPQSSVRAIAQDRKGFLWIGTETGLYRYDGYRFTEHVPPGGAAPVIQITPDSRGRIWTSWFGKPATVFDPLSGEWNELALLTSGYFEQGFVEGPDDRVWVADSNRLMAFDPDSLETIVMISRPASEEAISRHKQFAVWFNSAIWTNLYEGLLAIDPDKHKQSHTEPVASDIGRRMWIHADVLWYCNESGVYIKEKNRPIKAVFSDPGTKVLSCAHDSTGDLWIGTRHDGAFRISSEQLGDTFSKDDAVEWILRNQLVLAIEQDSRHQLWFLTRGRANRYSDGQIETFTYNKDSIVGHLGGLAARSLFEDRSGVLWLGTEGSGLARISPYASKFRHVAPPSQINPHVRKPAVDSQGDLWMGTNQDGVYHWRRAKNLWVHHASDAAVPNLLKSGNVRAMLSTQSGDLWVGGGDPGVLSRLEPGSNNWKNFEDGDSGIYALHENSDGTILVGRHSDIAQFDPGNQSWRRFQLPQSGTVRALSPSRSGRVYVGTHDDQGLLEFEPHRGFVHSWTDVIGAPNIFSVFEDDAGIVWVGTWGSGLIRLDPLTGASQTISAHEGLPDDTVFGILPGAHGEIWISTYRGLARITGCVDNAFPCALTVTAFDESDGLQQLEFDSEAYLRTPNGELFFGGKSGFSYFHAEFVGENSVPPVVRLSEVTLNGESLRPGAISHGIDIEHNFGVLEIRFSALDFHKPENSQYEYRLDPADNWTSLDNSPALSLTNLGWGKHDLQIRGSNNDGVWSELPLVFPIRVAPPVYFSYQAIAAYLLGLFLFMILVIRLRERHAHRYQTNLEALVEQRTEELAAANLAKDEFYANISHELRTPLTLLMHSAERIGESRLSDKAKKLIADIKRHADHLQHYVDGLISVGQLNSVPEDLLFAEDLAQFLTGLVSDLQLVAGDTRVEISQFARSPVLVRSQPKALGAIFSNLLLNALRHTPDGGRVVMTIENDQDEVVVVVADSGVGIDPEIIDSLFDRGVRGRSDPLRSQGFGIGLALVKQTIEALGGSIEASNGPDGGAQFVVRLKQADSSLPITTQQRSALVPLDVDNANAVGIVPGKSSASGTKHLVLLVEDNTELGESIRSSLGSSYRVAIAETGNAAKRFASDYVPDLVLCDVMLPDCNGFDILTYIKSKRATDHVPVVMLTALADQNSKRRGLEARADGYITKPFSLDALALKVRNVLDDRIKVKRHAAMKVWRDNNAPDLLMHSGERSFEQRFMETLEVLHSDSDTSVDDLSSYVAMSRRQLERKTRFCFDMSPNEMLSEYRLAKAADMLRRKAKVVDVAVQCGFGSHGHFATVFKKRFGTTPGNFRDAVSSTEGKE